MRITKKWALVILVASALVGVRLLGWSLFNGHVNALQLDLRQPDAWIHTTSLSQLPRDILRVPIAKDVLTEDFVYYYEQNDDRLGLKGSLRRIAYEHDLAWTDRLLTSALNEPAEVAIWRDNKGSLRYYLVAMTRNHWAKLIQGLGEPVLKEDRQLTLAGNIRDGFHSIPVLAFNYTNGRTLLLVSQGDRIAVLSDPGMLLDSAQKPNSESAKVILDLLSDTPAKRALYAAHFHTQATPNTHTLVFSANFLSFGYQHFFPGLQALRFDVRSDQPTATWATQALLTGKQLTMTPATQTALWKALPVHPAACASLPVDWSQGKALVTAGKLENAEQLASIFPQLEGPAGVCWFQESHLHTPVFVATLKPGAKLNNTQLTALYQWALRVPPSVGGGKNEAITIETAGTSTQWHSTIDAPFGINADHTSFEPTLLRLGNTLVFSPDRSLTKLVGNTLQRRYPNMGDVLPDSARTLAVLEPQMLASMTERETFEALPKEDEPVFHNAAKQHLLPKLAAMKHYPGVALTLHDMPSAGTDWVAVDWRPLSSKQNGMGKVAVSQP